MGIICLGEELLIGIHNTHILIDKMHLYRNIFFSFSFQCVDIISHMCKHIALDMLDY